MTLGADDLGNEPVMGASTEKTVTRNGSATLRILAGIVLIVVFAAIFGRIMGYGLRRDELMFVPPAALLGQWSLYSDFFYNHVPNSAWYYRIFYVLTGDSGLLGSARIGLFCAWVLMSAGVGWVTYAISRSGPLAVFFVVSLAVNETLLAQSGMAASNNLLPLAFAVWGLGLFVSETLRDAPRPVIFALAGVLLSVAAGLKVSAFMFIPPVAVAAFLLPGHLPFAARLRGVVLPTLVGGLVGALPLFVYFAADPGSFVAHVVAFHTGPHVAYWQANAASEPGLALGLGGKIQLAYAAWFAGAALVGALILIYLVVVSGTFDRAERTPIGQIMLMLAVLALTAAFSFVPTPGFPQYYIQPLIALPILAALIFRVLGVGPRLQALPVLCAGFAILFILGAPRLAPGLISLTNPAGFTTARIAQGGQVLAEQVAESEYPDGPVATLMPIYPLEAHLPVYPELATGPFAYRIAPFTDSPLAQAYRMAGAEDLAAIFDSNPPSAFLLGYDSALEEPLLRYAETNGYAPAEISELDNRYGQGVVYLKRKEAAN